MTIYKTRWFARWANKQGLTSPSLCAAVREMTEGLYDADLGNGLLKKRIARPGQGKRSGFRTLVATNKGNCWIYKDEEVALKLLAAHLLSLTAHALDKAQHAGELMEVNCDAQD